MKRKARRILIACVFAAALVGMLTFAGCSSSSNQNGNSANTTSTTTSEPAVELQIFAANSLEKALPEVQALYTQEHPNVTFADTQFQASGTLTSKLKSGATADLLITASSGSMDTAVSDGTVDQTTRTDLFKNDLVICTSSTSNVTITSLADLATDKVTSIAIGDPNTVPAGNYAIQALQSAGLCTYTTDSSGKISVTWDASIADKINAGADSVGTVASYVQSGTCQVGFVYTSDIFRYDSIKVAYTTASDSHKAIKYPGAVCTSATNAAEAADFMNFCLTDPDAIAIFEKYGFELV
jgi:molybdate transport system substrate-binding protein